MINVGEVQKSGNENYMCGKREVTPVRKAIEKINECRKRARELFHTWEDQFQILICALGLLSHLFSQVFRGQNWVVLQK